ncbi:TPA: amidohydrolase family protein [Candidatus Bathyarchaeota archaeon]|nr:amidohydrolase family protein [Candidatus Bathyarchaeota archaeon]
MEYDVLIKNTRIIDGSGKAAYKGGIGVSKGKIAALGEVKGDAKKMIDAKGLYASPGWIDAHSHSDTTILFYPKAESYVFQGVTTFVGGECGGSPAPIGDLIKLPGIAADYLDELMPHKFYPEKDLLQRETVNKLMKEKFGWTVDWRTMAEWFKKVDGKASVNVAPLVGQGNARYMVMGEDYKRFAKPNEVEKIKGVIKSAMDDGCIGLSTGLDYDPGVWASMDEINACVSVLKEYPNSVYCPHWRRTGRRRDVKAGDYRPNKLDGILESIESCRKTGVPTNLAHLTPAWRLVPEGDDDMEEANYRRTLKFIDDARAEGLQLTFDHMPWFIFGGFSVMPYLCSFLTPWLKEQGSRQKLAEWLKVPDYRKEVIDDIQTGKWFIRLAYNPNSNPQWAENIWVTKHNTKGLAGKHITQIAKERGKNPLDTWFDLICEDPDSRGVAVGVAETGSFPQKPFRALFFQHPVCALSLDQTVVDTTREQKTPPYNIPGINTFAAFPGFINEFVKKHKLFTLEQAIRVMSTQAADNHFLKGRGRIIPGSVADVTIFDYDKLEITGDAVEPRKYPKGIVHVLVNGVPVVENGKHTGATPGRVVKRAQ